MPADDLIIANLALDLVGEAPIAQLEQENAAAEACARNLPEARRLVLYGHPWKVAMKLARLPASATAPEWGFQRAFDLPPDCVRAFYVDGEEEGEGRLWTVRGNRIETDIAAPLPVEYISGTAADAARDPMLQKAIAIELARRINPGRSEDEGRGDRLDALYEKCIREARSVSSFIGSQRRRIAVSQMEMARFGGADVGEPIFRRFGN